MKRIFLIVGMIFCAIGATLYLLAAFGTKHGDGFGNIGGALVGGGIFFVGLIPLTIGSLLGRKPNSTTQDQ